MIRKSQKLLSFFLSVLICFMMLAPAISAASADVEDVIAKLEAIDTLEEMQAERKKYACKGYNASNSAIVDAQRTAKLNYETYLEQMFAARLEAQSAYDALSQQQKDEIPDALKAKLDNQLDTVFKTGTYPVTKSDNEYTYQIISPKYMVYELSSSIIKTGDVGGTFVVVDTKTAGDTFTLDTPYSYGESNYDLTYCCDLITSPVDGTLYKRTNLENSDYYDVYSAQVIRAIVEKSYPFLTIDEMKAELIKGGLDEEFVASLDRSDIITSVQMAIWAYANVNDPEFSYDNVTHYGGTLRLTPHRYGIPSVHDYSNELWYWYNSASNNLAYNETVENRVNRLTEYLCALEPVAATKEQTVISEAEVVRAELVSVEENIYNLTLYVGLNGGGNERDNLEIIATSYSENEDGSISVTDTETQKANIENDLYTVEISAKEGDTVKVEIDGTQYLSKGAYFYSAEGGREASQALVGVCEGETPVKASKEILFTQDIIFAPEPDGDVDGGFKPRHFIVFGKTEKIGWYSVSLDGGESFITVFGNSHLEVPQGTEIIVRANDVFGDPFTFYVNGEAVKPDDNGYVKILVDRYLLIGALGIPVEAPDTEQSLNFFEKIIKAFKDFFAWIGSWFK